jgi:hypothetical protein
MITIAVLAAGMLLRIDENIGIKMKEYLHANSIFVRV